MFDKSLQRELSSYAHVKGESFRGGHQNRGRGRNISGRASGRGKNNFPRSQNDVNTQPRCNICKGLLMLKKIVSLGENLNVTFAKSLAMSKKIVGTKQVSKHTSPKKMKMAKAHSMHLKP